VNDPLPIEIRGFIAQQIESLAQLEAILLMKRESQRSWNAVELARQLYLSEEMCGAMLEELERRQFTVRDAAEKSFRYACPDARADELLGRLAGLYVERRVAVISEIYSNPVSKVKTFADAFRLRKDEP
jgi:hypothetical protein